MTRSRFGAFSLGWLLAALSTNASTAGQPVSPAPWLLKLEHSPRQPHGDEPVKISALVQASVTNVVVQYQLVEPGTYIEFKDSAYKSKWVAVPMQPGSGTEGQREFAAELPRELQKHRRLIRYRIAAQDLSGHRCSAPASSNVPPNYAYFVYDGIPPWTGAIDPKSNDHKLSKPITFSAEAMRQVQAYHLIGKKRSIENATWNEQEGGKEYRYTGTLVVEGEVFDHIGYRARGGIWRYALGKNMWKFYLPGEHTLQARDDFGRLYPVPWNKINLRSCIQQGDYGHRGEQGMFESVGFRLFNLAGVPAPNTHWIQLRIIDEAKESPADQYRSDFWGLYLAIENEDGRFLKAHGLPNGNLYKIEGGGGELAHHGTGAVTNHSDLSRFMLGYSRPNASDAWWRTNVNLPSYYSYRAICECIHHYDIGMGKNYDYYHNPLTGQWQVVPWDIDLTWANNMFGNGEEPFKRRVLSREVFRIEYQNRLREIRDLLFNPEQTGQMIDEYAAVIWAPGSAPSIVEADRRKWDYHPIMATSGKAGQGLFYEAARTRDFRGMVQLMKDYVRSRGRWIDSTLLSDSNIPETPSISSVGPASFPATQLRFRASAYKGANDFTSIRWRLAEVNSTNAPAGKPRPPRLYEITPVWESPELKNATDEMALPEAVVKVDHSYRVRARVKDVTGRWSHWSAPVEFTVGK